MVVVLVIAFVLEAVGLVCAAIGFSQTWHEHAGGQDFWAPVKERLSRSGLNRWVGRLLHRSKSVTVGLGLASEMNMTGSIRGKVTPGPLPDPASDLPAFADRVEHYIQQLYEMTQRTHDALADETEGRAAAEKDIRNRITAEIERVEGMSRQVAVGGLRLQVVGWTFLFAGLVLGTIGNIWQAANSLS
jgi:hypothetical protein